MKLFKLPIYALAAASMTASTIANAWWDDDDELEFEEAYLYFELNDTDGDLGIHGKVDGDAWKWVAIENPNERRVLYVLTRGGIRKQGLTELFFESAEPCFPTNPDCDDPLDPVRFFKRFPEGWYEYEGRTLDGKEIEGEVYLSKRIPAAPVVLSVGGGTPPEIDEDGELGCWGEPGDDVVIEWMPVTTTHALLGSDTGAPLGDNNVIYYEFVVEIDGTEYKSTALVPPGTNSWTVPEEFIDLTEGLMVENDEGELEEVEEIKFEIIVRVSDGQDTDDDGDEREPSPGNQSAVESCFDL